MSGSATQNDRASTWVWLLLIVGLLQMTGDVLGVRALEGVGAATGASPAPKVFSAVRGFETYSARFVLEWQDEDGTPRSLELTPAVYGRIEGPYNRRNVYGAALAYAPVLPPELRDPVFRHALCGEAPLLRELGVDPSTIDGPISVRAIPASNTTPDPDLELVLVAPCR